VFTGCKYGFPQVLVSPSKLDDGELFAQWAWLTCPFLCKSIARVEDKGACEQWTEELKKRSKSAQQLHDIDARLRQLRAAEATDGIDHCAKTGLAGSADPLKVKCIHAHVAYFLTGLNDPIGKQYLSEHSRTCADRRCLRHSQEEG
jgi:hypothetical protein